MATNPVASISTADQLSQALKTVTGAALFIEQLLSASGVNGFDATEAEQITAAFGNLATIAIQAAHDAGGKAVTADSVLALMPVNTALNAGAAS